MKPFEVSGIILLNKVLKRILVVILASPIIKKSRRNTYENFWLKRFRKRFENVPERWEDYGGGRDASSPLRSGR